MMDVLGLLERADKRHRQRLAEIGVDIEAIYRAYQDARYGHPHVEAVVPPPVYHQLREWAAEENRYAEERAVITGRPGMGAVDTSYLIGCPVVVEGTESGGVEFRPCT